MSSPSSAIAPTTGTTQVTEDLGPLAWVLGEVQKSLENAGKTLRRFARDSGDSPEVDIAPLRITRQQMHQVVGALQMVGQPAPALVLGAVEFAIQSFVGEPLRCTEAAVIKIERAGFAVSDFLNAMLAGKTVSSVALFAQYRDVLELVGNERVHPADLWTSAWRWVEIRPAPSQPALVYDPAVRSKLDREVLNLVKSGDDHAARRLHRLCLGLARGASAPRVTSFWMLAAGFFEALALALISADSYVKRAASRVLLQYATLARGDNTVSDRLGQDLLFFCAQAAPGPRDDASTLRAVRTAWGVANEQSVDYTVEQFGRFDPLVLAQARKRIETAKEMWSTLSGGDVTRTRQVADAMGQLGESLQRLHPPSAPMAQALNNAVENSARSGRPPSTELAMEVATSVLYLEAAFEDLDPHDRQLTARTIQLAGRIERVRGGGQSEPLEPWMEELYRRVSDRQTMGTVVDELRSHLSELEKSLDQFSRRPAERALLRGVPSQLLQMRGVFSVLGLDQAAQTVLRMRENVDHMLSEERSESEARDFDSLGNNLGALGFLIDMLSYQPALAKRLFVFDVEAGELKPLMGRQANDANREADPASVASIAPSAVEMVSDSVLSVDEVDAQIAAKLAALAGPGRKSASPIEEFSRATDSWTTKITGPAPLEGLPDTEVTELEEDDLQNIFLDEAREVLHNGLAAVAALSGQTEDDGGLTVLRRAFHTLKGSSRMVGLTDFGEAAWSFEQVLNTWLADQQPATPELLTVMRKVLEDFAKWVEAVASNEPHAWHSAPFRSAAEGLRTGEPLAASVRVADADALVAAARHIAAEESASKPEALPLPMPDLPDLELVHPVFTDGDRDEVQGFHEEMPEPDSGFAATDFLDFDGHPAPPLEESELPVELDEIDFLETTHVSIEAVPHQTPQSTFAKVLDGEDVQPPVATVAAEIDLPLSSPPPIELEPAEPDDAALEGEPVIEGAMADGAVESSVEGVAVEAELPETSHDPIQEDARVEAEVATVHSADDQVKVIGPLRIGIALYNVYLVEADEWSRQLTMEVGEWALEPHVQVADSTIALAHSLAGSSATVGFNSLSGMARLFEAALQHLHMQGRGTAAQGVVLVSAADELRYLLHQFAAGFLKEPAPETLQSLRNVAASVILGDAGEFPVAGTSPPRRAIADVSLDDSDDAIDAIDGVDAELFPIFEEEAAELLPTLAGALRAWANNPDDSAPRSSTLRTLHTLKGSARLAGAMRLGERAHRMESEIEAIGGDRIDRRSIDQLLARFDSLQASFEALRVAGVVQQGKSTLGEDATSVAAEPEDSERLDGREVADPPAEAVVPVEALVRRPPIELTGETVRRAVAIPTSIALTPLRAASGQAVRIRTQLLDRLVAQAGEVIITRSRIEAELGQLRSSLGDLTGNLDRLRQQLRDIEVQAESQMQSRLAQAKDSQQGFDPLEFDRFTRVQELTRMMAESVNDVATVQRTLQKTVQSTEDDLSAQARQTRELQRGLLRTRMVEFDNISERLYRVVRQASKDTGKQVRLDIVGGTIEMDRGVLDRMMPAFEHLLRNCVAHGIEAPAVREKAGKDANGLIVIELHHEGNDVSVSFRDDGAGLDQERISARALALGMISPEQSVSDDELVEMIFKPGFSTVDQVSELAGRGIGMDVVRAEIAALGGRIETQTKKDEGTSFRLVLPLTTAVTHVVMLRIGAMAVGVPSNIVELVQRVGASELEAAYQRQRYGFGGEQLPFFWAGALLQSSAHSELPSGKTSTVVIVRSAAQRIALHVDEVLGNHEVVVKNLGPQLSRLPGMAGISVLTSGEVALIYNPVALAAVHGQKARDLQASRRSSTSLQGGDGHSPAQERRQLPLILVVDDSITVRRVTQRLLQREGFRVTLAADGLQALERLQQERPAVVLSDIEMPRMDGFDLARNIRADQALAGLPIIMITSRIAEKHREHARALGVNHYLGKPYSEDELLRLVRSFIDVEVPAPAMAA